MIHTSVDAGFLETLSADKRQSCDETYLESHVRRGFDALEEIIVDRVVSDGERTVDDATVDVDSKINAEDVVVLKNHILLARIRGPVSSDIVQAKACREAHASFQGIAGLCSLVSDQSTHTAFDLVGELGHGDAWLGNGLDVLANLTMYLRGFAVIAQKVHVHVAYCGQMTKLFCGRTLKIIISVWVVYNPAFGIRLVLEDICERYAWRTRLLSS